MIIGHIGIAFAARAVKRDAPLLWLIVASVAPDIVDVVLGSAGVCNATGVDSHSLAAVAATAVVLGAASAWATRSGRTGMLVAALVIVHLLVDYVTGLKVLWAHGPIVGLDLYHWPIADFALEAPVIVGGWWLAQRWGDLPRWLDSWLVPLALVCLQAAADGSQRAENPGPPAACAKADILKGARRLF
ncbi:MAG TPA: hypothetical protein VIJ16_07370 [Gemmatimonadaceae bacterium]